LTSSSTAANKPGRFGRHSHKQSSTGVWTNLGSPVDGAYAHIWGYSGTNLTPIYWGDKANNYGTGITTRPGHQYALREQRTHEIA
jgi:hypothetical protein